MKTKNYPLRILLIIIITFLIGGRCDSQVPTKPRLDVNTSKYYYLEDKIFIELTSEEGPLIMELERVYELKDGHSRARIKSIPTISKGINYNLRKEEDDENN